MNEESNESVVWKGGPSQWTNFWTLALCVVLAAAIVAGSILAVFPPLLIALVIPLGWAGWALLVLRCEVYELTEQRLRFSSGVFSRRIDEIELYRVKDSSVAQPFVLRLFGLGNVLVETSDRNQPQVCLAAVKDPVGVREHLRRQVERIRDSKRVREVDFDDRDDSGDFEPA
jgi:uncharacterized membrane protein YdbT with pleckstrin-like domain